MRAAPEFKSGDHQWRENAVGVAPEVGRRGQQAQLRLPRARVLPQRQRRLQRCSGLDVTFAPSSRPNASCGARSPNDDDYAFVNGIEVVPVPAGIATKHGPTFASGNVTIQYPKDEDSAAYIYAVAFGVSYPKDDGNVITIQYPPSVPPHVAPESVYASARSMGPSAQVNLNYNLTRILPVNAGFYYILRFHSSTSARSSSE